MKRFISLLFMSIIYLFFKGNNPFLAADPVPAQFNDFVDNILNNVDNNVLRVIGERLVLMERELEEGLNLENISTNENRINWQAIALWAGASLLAFLIIRYGPSLFDYFKDTSQEIFNGVVETLFNHQSVKEIALRRLNDPRTYQEAMNLLREYTPLRDRIP